MPGPARKADPEEMETTRPHLRSIMPPSTWRLTRNAPVRLVAIILSQSSSVIWCTAAPSEMPAQLTRMSAGPRSSSSCWPASATDGGSPTSHVTQVAQGTSSAGGTRSSTATAADAAVNWATIAEPMPPEPPVTHAVRPDRSSCISSPPREAAAGPLASLVDHRLRITACRLVVFPAPRRRCSHAPLLHHDSGPLSLSRRRPVGAALAAPAYASASPGARRPPAAVCGAHRPSR